MPTKKNLLIIFVFFVFLAGAKAQSEPLSTFPVLLGVKVKPGCRGHDDIDHKNAWLGFDYDLLLDFFAYKTEADFKSAGWWVRCWEKKNNFHMVFSLGMLPEDGSWTFEKGASGEYNEVFRQIATLLSNSSIKKPIIIRLGWEFNGNWYAWSAANAPSSDIWKQYWRNIVDVFKEVSDSDFLFDWTINADQTKKIRVEDYYPGDAYVDIVGMDVYNFRGFIPASLNWSRTKKSAYGLNWLTAFSKSHKKKISIPEWGTGEPQKGFGGGEDQLFMKNMLEWISVNQVFYSSYWDEESSYDASLSAGKHPILGRLYKDWYKRRKSK